MNIWPWSRIRQQAAEIDRLTANLRNESAQHQREEQALRNQVDFLIREIRKTDDIIFSMGQAADGSWRSVQPRFAQLHDQMTARKVAESSRINSLVVGELHKTYRPEFDDMGKQQASLPSPVDGKR